MCTQATFMVPSIGRKVESAKLALTSSYDRVGDGVLLRQSFGFVAKLESSAMPMLANFID